RVGDEEVGPVPGAVQRVELLLLKGPGASVGRVQLRVLAQVEAVRAYRFRGVHPHQEVEQGRGRARATSFHEQGPTLLQVPGQVRPRRDEAVLPPVVTPPGGPFPTG